MPPPVEMALPYPPPPLDRKSQPHPQWAFFRSLLGVFAGGAPFDLERSLTYSFDFFAPTIFIWSLLVWLVWTVVGFIIRRVRRKTSS